MELTTRCPQCGTVFPATLEQLQLRKGYIRCINCAHIFDGFDAVVPNEPARPSQPAPAAPAPAAPAVSAPAPSAPMSPKPEPGPFIIPPVAPLEPDTAPATRPFSIGRAAPASDGEPKFQTPSIPPAATETAIQREPHIPAVLRDRSAMARTGAAAPRSPGFTISDSPPSTLDPEDDDTLYMEPRAGHRSRARAELFDGPRQQRGGWIWLWAILALCGVVLLAAQGAYVYRAQLANTFPVLRPMLVSACERLGCDVPYERRIDAIAITGSALRSSAPAEGDVSRLTLEVTLRNTHVRPQEWPTLVLDLKDASGAVVVRRNLTPDIWVPTEQRAGPFEAGSELAVQLPVSVRGLQANGYQLDKFFP